MSVALRGDWFRKVSNPADATFYECDRHVQRALKRVSTKHWIAEIQDYTRTGGTKGQIIRISPKNPVKGGRYFVREIVHKPTKKAESWD